MLTVVREGTNLLHHEPATPDSLRTSTGAVVGVLPQKAASSSWMQIVFLTTTAEPSCAVYAPS